MIKRTILVFLLSFLFYSPVAYACSVIYYIDSKTGKIYVANNEDYYFDVGAYIQIEPKSENELARLWYGWNDFAQGGINEAGLFFDGAVTPEQPKIKGAKKYKGNLGDDLLANYKTVPEALTFLEKIKLGLKDAHIMLGDAHGNAVVVEWIDGEKKIIAIENNTLVMTNFLLADPTKGNYPCPRYEAIEKELDKLQVSETPADFKMVGQAIAPAVQIPTKDEKGRTGGTLYTTFLNISDMEFVLVYKLDNTKITKLDLKSEFEENQKKKIELN